jgi:galactoside O-acetyltransferase
MDSFFNETEVKELGFKKVGLHVKVSRRASFYNIFNISIGDNVRIDDFCILSGNIELHSHIHISAYTALYGNSGIILEDYSGLSPRTTIFSEVDDFSGNYLVGPVHKSEFRNLTKGTVMIKRFSQVGANTVILPGVIIGEGVAVGAMSLVTKSLDAWGIYAGIPAKRIKERSRELLKLMDEQGFQE